MKKAISVSLAALCTAALFPSDANAQRRERGITSSAALERIATKHRPELAQRIVEMKGRRGQSQPMEWWLVVHDERSPYRLRTMWVGDVRATDEGENSDFYPDKLPVGFASTAKLKLDSTKAFDVMVREAHEAKVGFDSVDYLLRAVEFSNEPLWSLTARDKGGNVVGRVALSGYDGRVFRSVWFFKQPSGYPKIIDSALDGLPDQPSPHLELKPKKLIERPGIDPEVPELLEDPGDPGTEEAEVEEVDPQ